MTDPLLAHIYLNVWASSMEEEENMDLRFSVVLFPPNFIRDYSTLCPSPPLILLLLSGVLDLFSHVFLDLLFQN